MVYLDYSATTPVNKEVLETFNNVSTNFIGNSNSLHKLGINSKKLEESATKQIADILKVKNSEIIYTSGASESNNMALKGIALKYQNRGKHILTVAYSHSSVLKPLKYLESLGFIVEEIDTDEYGRVSINSLKEKIKDDTILVSIPLVDSETGILQPIDEIGKILREYPKLFFHVDATQGIGKINFSLENIDLMSASAHKIYGIKGIGLLVKKENIDLIPLINGGKSTTKYRSGTPPLALIVSFSKALRLATSNIIDKYKYVEEINKLLQDGLKKYEGVYINNNKYTIPYILNISFIFMKPETLLHALEEYEIYISTQSACTTNDISMSVLALTNDIERSKHSVRISLSNLTSKDDIKYFLECFDKIYCKYKK